MSAVLRPIVTIGIMFILSRRNSLRPLKRASVLESDTDLGAPSPNDMGTPGNAVRFHREHKAVREPKWTSNLNAGARRGDVANNTFDCGRSKQNLSRLEKTTSLGYAFLLHGSTSLP